MGQPVTRQLSCGCQRRSRPRQPRCSPCSRARHSDPRAGPNPERGTHRPLAADLVVPPRCRGANHAAPVGSPHARLAYPSPGTMTPFAIDTAPATSSRSGTCSASLTSRAVFRWRSGTRRPESVHCKGQHAVELSASLAGPAKASYAAWSPLVLLMLAQEAAKPSAAGPLSSGVCWPVTPMSSVWCANLCWTSVAATACCRWQTCTGGQLAARIDSPPGEYPHPISGSPSASDLRAIGRRFCPSRRASGG